MCRLGVLFVESYEAAPTACVHKKVVMGDAVDALHVGWSYDEKNQLSRMIKQMKAHGGAAYSLAIADFLAASGWSPLLDPLRNWALSVGSRVNVVPVPSRFGTSERLAAFVAAWLGNHAITVLDHGLLERTDSLAQVKRTDDWGERAKLAERLFRIKDHCSPVWPALLVDDVVTSGASLRACARLLRGRGVTLIGGAVLAGNLVRWG